MARKFTSLTGDCSLAVSLGGLSETGVSFSNLPVEMPLDHLIEFNDLMPDRLEMELIKKGDLPFTPLGLEKMRSDL